MFVTNAKLTSIVVLALPLVIARSCCSAAACAACRGKARTGWPTSAATSVKPSVRSRPCRPYNHQAQDRQRFAGTVERAFDTARKRIAQRAWLITVVIVLVLGAVGVMLWVGGRDVIAGSISAGELAAFVFYSLIVGMAFGTLSEVIGELRRAAGSAKRIAELLRAQRDPPASATTQLAARVSGRIDCGRCASPIRPVPNTGPSTTSAWPSNRGNPGLVRTFRRQPSRPCSICSCVSSDPQQGRLLLDGQPIVELDPADLRRSFALVSQNPRCSSAASRGKHPLRPSACQRRRGRGRSACRACPRVHPWVCRRATPPTWARAASACPAGASA